MTSDVKIQYNHTITISNILVFYDPKVTHASYKMNYETENGNSQFSCDCDDNDYDQDDYANLPYSKINPVIDIGLAVGIFLKQNLLI